MVAFRRYTDPLLVQTNHAPAGANWFDCRAVWHGLEAITVNNGGFPDSVWYRDQGPVGMDAAQLEPRAFCVKGGLSFQFNGRTLVVRLNVAWSWFTGATVRIDGQAPSTLGLLTARDTLSCDANTYGLLGDGYVDVLVADGLADAPHAATIHIANTDPAKFFSIAGFKVGYLGAIPLRGRPTWLTAAAVDANVIRLTLRNRQDVPIRHVRLTFPPNILDGASYDIDPLEALTETELLVTPSYTGNELSAPVTFPLGLLAYYPDPVGSSVFGTDFNLPADDDAITFAPVPWFADTATPDGSPRAHCNARLSSGVPWTLSFAFAGDTLDLVVQRSAGWGVLGLYRNAGCTILAGTADCSVDEGGAFHTYHFEGFGPGAHTIWLAKTIDDGLPVIFVRALWSTVSTYTAVPETITLTTDARQLLPMWPVDVAIGDYDATFDPPDPAAHDYDHVPVRSNADVVETETLARFPTFAVFYGSGHRERLAGYDVLIVDPIGAEVDDVLYWQSLGIKVFGYVASLEEVGFYQDRYDFGSPLAPRKDGTGPGGYSSNYMFTKNPVAGPPDRNGTWASYYMDPRPGSGWKERIVDYYLPQIYGGSEVVTEEAVITQSVTIAAGPRIVFDIVKPPIDEARDITVTTADGAVTYARYSDYTYDRKTGAFVLATNITPPVAAGQTLKVSYTRKGHQFDGLFWDVVDDVDIYESSDWGFEFVPGYKEAAAAMINEIGALNPTKGVISNRGFTILPDIIAGCTGVMFESWLTLPTDMSNLAATDYYRVTDPAVVAFNDNWNALLRELRRRHVFDVYSLNYAVNGPAGDALRQYCRMIDAQQGYLSWQTIITLNNPDRNAAIDTPDPRIQSSAFRVVKRTGFDPRSVWDGGASVWDGGVSRWDIPT